MLINEIHQKENTTTLTNHLFSNVGKNYHQNYCLTKITQNYNKITMHKKRNDGNEAGT